MALFSLSLSLSLHLSVSGSLHLEQNMEKQQHNIPYQTVQHKKSVSPKSVWSKNSKTWVDQLVRTLVTLGDFRSKCASLQAENPNFMALCQYLHLRPYAPQLRVHAKGCKTVGCRNSLVLFSRSDRSRSRAPLTHPFHKCTWNHTPPKAITQNPCCVVMFQIAN